MLVKSTSLYDFKLAMTSMQSPGLRGYIDTFFIQVHIRSAGLCLCIFSKMHIVNLKSYRGVEIYKRVQGADPFEINASPWHDCRNSLHGGVWNSYGVSHWFIHIHTLRVHYAHAAANLNSGYSKYAKVARMHYFCTIALRTSRAVLTRAWASRAID